MADVIRRNPLGTDSRHFGGDDRHRADEIRVHHRPQKRSWWPFVLLGLLAIGLMALWSYARRHRMSVDARAPVERISPALPAPPPEEPPAGPRAPMATPPAAEPEGTEAQVTEPDGGEMAEEQPRPDQGIAEQRELGATAAGACNGEFLFAPNETALDAKDERALKDFSDCLKADPSITAVIVEGRADPRGSAEYNEGLARDRAQSVVSALTARGVPSEKLMIGIGDHLCSDSTQACRQRNRSVIATSKR
jgi:outer membrane protein OmpA-like peptidoglycan-associated protein